MRAIAVGLTLFSLSACSRTHYAPADVAYHRDAWREFNKAAASFSVDDGIDRSEAKFLAWAFFNWQISGCGFPEEPQDVDTEWQARPMTGISGRPATHVIRINKRTGAVSYGSNPPIAADLVIRHERETRRDNLRLVGESAEGE